jgi:hypothetical protein
VAPRAARHRAEAQHGARMSIDSLDLVARVMDSPHHRPHRRFRLRLNCQVQDARWAPHRSTRWLLADSLATHERRRSPASRAIRCRWRINGARLDATLGAVSTPWGGLHQVADAFTFNHFRASGAVRGLWRGVPADARPRSASIPAKASMPGASAGAAGPADSARWVQQRHQRTIARSGAFGSTLAGCSPSTAGINLRRARGSLSPRLRCPTRSLRSRQSSSPPATAAPAAGTGAVKHQAT